MPRIAGQPTCSGGAAARPVLLELAQSGRIGAKSVSDEDDYLAVLELLKRAEYGYEAVRPVSRVLGLFPLSTDLTNEQYLNCQQRLQDAGVDEGVAAGVDVVAKQDAFGSHELGQRTLDLLSSSSLTAQTLKSYAGLLLLSQFAEFCHDSENMCPLEATTATVVRLRKGAASAANAIGTPLSHIRYHGGWATNSDVVLDYIDPNVLPSPGAWFFFGHIGHFQVQQDSAAVAFPWFEFCLRDVVTNLGTAPFVQAVYEGRSGRRTQFARRAFTEEMTRDVKAFSELAKSDDLGVADTLMFVHRVSDGFTCPNRSAGLPPCDRERARLQCATGIFDDLLKEGLVGDCDDEEELGAEPCTGGVSETSYWGMVVQSRGSGPAGCFLLKTTQKVGGDCKCTHYSLTRVCEGVPLDQQFIEAWNR
eukprot:jgi/Tetstr1/453311/TSEL_040302.t1